MVVESDRHWHRLYTEALEGDGHKVIAVGFGRDALRLLDEILVDLVLLDLKIADGNGLDYMQKMLIYHRNLKIVINTAYPVFTLDFRYWGAERILIKSSDLSELKQAVHEVLGNSNGSASKAAGKESKPKIVPNKAQCDSSDSQVFLSHVAYDRDTTSRRSLTLVQKGMNTLTKRKVVYE